PPSETNWTTAEQLRTLDSHQIAAGVAQHSETGLYHTWVSLYGADLTSWYIGPDAREAQAFVLAIEELFSTWSYTPDDTERMNALLELAVERSTAPGATLPDAQVRHLLAEVA